MRPPRSWPVALLAATQLIRPSHSLLDSGGSLDAEDSASDKSHQAHDKPISVQGTPAGSLVVTDSEQVGLRPGCRRTTDFFDQVCNTHSESSLKGLDHQASSSLLTPVVTADLLVCDLPEVEPLIRPETSGQASQRPSSATYAVSGTIVVHGADAKECSDGGGLPELADSSTSQSKAADADDGVHNPSASQADAAYPGPDDEGFWRQRDGRHEWHPASHQVTPQTKRNGVSDDTQESILAKPQLPRHHDASRLSEYDAWSAEQEQGAFLSFKEWKERYAQDPSGQSRRSSSHTPRTNSPDQKSQTRSASPDFIAPPHQTGIDQETRQSDTDQVHHRESEARTTHTSEVSTSTTPSATATSAPGPAGTTETAEPEPSSVKRPLEEALPVPKVGLSVAAGATGQQLATLKHRWNFASLDCAAVVHRTNPEAKFASAILSEKKDRYMLSPCPQPDVKTKGGSQFVIVELCEQIKIDTIVLANYEFFSNMFKKFTVTAAEQLTGRENDWTQLGVFRARNVRGQQVFRIPSAPRSDAFFRYVRIDFQEHFGSEYYCPVSLLRVYGITEMEDFKNAELESALDVGELGPNSVEDAQQPLLDSADTLKAEVPAVRDLHPSAETAGLTSQDEDIWRKHEQAFQRKLQNQSVIREAAEIDIGDTFVAQLDNASSQAPPSPNLSEQVAQPATVRPQVSGGDDTAQKGHDIKQCAPEDDPNLQPLAKDVCMRSRLQEQPFYHLSRLRVDVRHLHAAAESGSAANSDRSPHNVSAKARPASAATDAGSADVDRNRRTTPQRQSGSLPSQQGNSGSESVYRAIHRRLNALESNATLSHSYIEHSGQMLREVFARMERRQDARMSDMLRALNASNWQQIETLKRRQHVDLQRAIFEFDVHRQQADNERRALLREVQILAEEVLLEKRLSIAQLIMLLIVFVFVGLTRGSRAVPLLHAGFTRIGRGSKRREAQTEAKAVLPASPSKAAHRMDAVLDARQTQISPSRESKSSQSKNDSRHGSRKKQPAPHINPAGTPTGHAQPLSLSPGLPQVIASPGAAKQNRPRSSIKNLVQSPTAGADARGERLIGVLSNPRSRGRLVMLLEALDALDRAVDLRRLSKSSKHHKVAAPRVKSRYKRIDATARPRPIADLHFSPSSDMIKRVPLSHRSAITYQQDQGLANGRRYGTPGRDKKADSSGFDDMAGMSSDWTERSENGEASENATYTSEDEDKAIRAARSDLISLEPVEELRANMALDRSIGRHTNPEPSNGRSENEAKEMLPANSVPSTVNAGRSASNPQLDKLAAATDLPSIARADGHLSSSDSESEGGAWHRVLPRRIGNSNSLRKARQSTVDGRIQRLEGETRDTKSDRASPRPSSAQGSAFKSQKPALSRFFRSSTPEQWSAEAPQNRRSGTPDTIRDVRPT